MFLEPRIWEKYQINVLALSFRPLPILRLITEIGLIVNNKKLYLFSVSSKFCFYVSFYCFMLAGTFRFVTKFNF